MQKEKISQLHTQFIARFPSLSFEEQETFIRFNSRFFDLERSINAVIQLYVQNPEAKILKTFKDWKAVAKEASVKIGEESLRTYKDGQVQGYYFDVRQTTVAGTYQENNTMLADRHLVSLLEEAANLPINQEIQPNVMLSKAEIASREILVPYLKPKSAYSTEEYAAAVIVSLQNLFERYGLTKDTDNPYINLLQEARKRSFEPIDKARILHVLNLGNSFSRGLIREIAQRLDTRQELSEDLVLDPPSSSEIQKDEKKAESVDEELTVASDEKRLEPEITQQSNEKEAASQLDPPSTLLTPEISEADDTLTLFDFDRNTSETAIEKEVESAVEQVNPAAQEEKAIQDFSFASYSDEDLKDFYPRTASDKVKANIQAIRLVKALEAKNQTASPDEQEVLAQYVGWGGLANSFFDESNPRFEALRTELKSLVSPREYASMRESSLTAYYTDPRLIQELYKSLETLGFQGGRLLDPSMGTGNFFASLPGSLKSKSELYGVELDPMTAALASQLQQSTHFQNKGFEKTNFADNTMDIVLTNVPFGQLTISDPKYQDNYPIHDYFIKKSLDLVHAGGFVAVLTSTHTLDKKDSRFRAELAKQANLIAAVRLPDNAFSKIAGTDIASDLLIFQKTKTPQAQPDWLETTSLEDEKGNQISYNRYFEKHPEQVLGTIGIKTFRGGVLSVQADYDLESLPDELSVALDNHEDTQFYRENQNEDIFEVLKSSDSSLPDEVLETIEPYTLKVFEGKPYYHNGETVALFQKTSSLTLNTNEKRQGQLKRYQNIKDSIFDEEIKWKPLATYKGKVVSGNFIPEETEQALPYLPDPEILTRLEEEKTVDRDDRRYTLTSTGLVIAQKASTQYFYHQAYSSDNVKAMEQMIALRETLQELLTIQHLPDYKEADYERLREKLNQDYDRFRNAFGPISSQANSLLMRQDDYYAFLSSIEEEKEDEVTKEPILVKSAVFFEPTIQAAAPVLQVENASDALLASLNHRGKLDFAYMSDIYGKAKEEIIKELGDKLFYVGEGNYQTREDYLSGDVKTKLQTAKNNQAFVLEDRDWTGNISALEAVIPADIPLSDISYQLGTRFIPNYIYQRFLMDALEQGKAENVRLCYDARSDSYEVKVSLCRTDAMIDKYGLRRYDGERLATTLLNLREPQIFKPDPEDLTGKKRILDKEATDEIQGKGNQLKEAFKDWVLKTPEVQEELVKLYNETFNRTVTKSYDGTGLTIKGLGQQFTLRPHQKNAIMRIVQEERAGLFHEVGSGKTLTMLASSMKLKELGLIQKPLYVVPKTLLDQFGREIYKYFPESKVLIARSSDFTKDNRKRFVSRIATGKYDAIVIADSQFEKVAMSKAYQEDYIEKQIEDLDNFLNASDEKNYTVKKAEQLKENLKLRLEKLQKTDVDSFINFEELGIDMLYVDEAHNFKNLAPMTQLQNVKGISDTRSQKAMDLEQKVQYLHSLYGNKRVVFATGTPLSNSVTELYTMTNYLAPDLLKREGVGNFDAWASTFGTIESVFELTASGGYKMKRRFTKFGNMPELRKLFHEIADIQTAEDLDLPVPKVETFAHQTQTTSAQARYIESLIERADKIESGSVPAWQDNMLKIVGENRKLTLDMRMLDDNTYDVYDSDKLEQVVEEVYKVWEATTSTHSTQMIFSDLGVPLKYKNTNSHNLDESINHFSVYDEIKQQLINKGVSEQEIRFIHEATDNNKESMMRDMRSGKIRVLMASTGKGGTGLNVQDKLIAVHHLDVPWRPSDIQQRNGRIIRQGNENERVQIHHYITKGSMDAFLWQTIENKKKIIDQIMSGKSDAREMEELDNNSMNPAFYKALSEGDPVKAEYMLLERELSLLTNSRNRYYESKASDEKKIERQKTQLPLFEQRLEATEKDISQAKLTEFKPFEMVLYYKDQEKHYGSEDKKSEVGDQFIQLIRENISGEKKKVKIATFRGFEIYHISHDGTKLLGNLDDGSEEIKIQGNTEYTLRLPLTSGSGTLERINNKIDSLEKDKEASSQEISRLKSAIQRIEEERDKPFSKEEEYKEKVARFEELQGQVLGNKVVVEAENCEEKVL